MEAPTVSIRRDVAAELAFAARYRADAYQACVLLGTTSASGLDVRGFIDLSTVSGPFLFLRTLVDDWTAMQRRAERSAPDLAPVGWASFRRNSNGELTPAESVVHRTFFNLPHQITLVVDSATEEMYAFGPDADGELVSIPLAPLDDALTSGASA